MRNITLKHNKWLGVNFEGYGPGYRVLLTWYSNKGPLLIVTDREGKEIDRRFIDVALITS